jgi:flagellar biosynthetic protein FliQ
VETIAAAGQQALWASLVIGGPVLILLLVIGLAVSVLQALTQVQEPSVAFVPKLLAVGVVLAVGAPAAVALMRGFAQQLFQLVAAVGGGR